MDLRLINEFIFKNDVLDSFLPKSFGTEISQKGREHRLIDGLIKVRLDKELVGRKKKLAAVNADSIKAYRCNTNGCQGRYHVYVKDGVEIGYEKTKNHTKCVERIVINQLFDENEESYEFLENRDENTGDNNHLEPIPDISTNQYMIFEDTKINKEQFSLMSIEKLNKEIDDCEVDNLLEQLKQIEKDRVCSNETKCFQNTLNNLDNNEPNPVMIDQSINNNDNTMISTAIYENTEVEITNSNVGYCDESETDQKLFNTDGSNSLIESRVLTMMEMLLSDETQFKLNSQDSPLSYNNPNIDQIYNNLYSDESNGIVDKIDQDDYYNQDPSYPTGNNNVNPMDGNNNPTYAAQQSQSHLQVSNSQSLTFPNTNTFASNLEYIIQNEPFSNPDFYINVGNEVLAPDDLNFCDEQMDFDF